MSEDLIEKNAGRKELIDARMPEVMNAITARFNPLQKEFDRRLTEAVTTNSSRRIKITKIQKITSEVRSISSEFSACAKGCSNCCYQRVMLSQVEC